MRTKKKNRWAREQQKQPAVREVIRLMGVGVYGGKDFWKRYVFSLEWKSEGVMDDDSRDSEEDEGEEDWLRVDKADVVKQEVCSRDEVMHVGMNDL